MANRNMQAKRMKLRRQLRGLPRQFHSEYVPVGRTPNQELIHGYKERAKSLAFDDKFMDSLIAHGRMEAQQRLNELHEMGRMSLLQHVARIQEVAPALICFQIVKSAVHRARVFRNSEETAFVLLYENYKEEVVKTSMTYRYRANLLEDFKRNKVKWVEFAECKRPPRSSG